ncbi:PIN domain-containing protein [Pseudoduganella sp. GCM10020061]|uniref:PIN domain-containing protein n=1 Tax=Pseudoduganella sp. GCM10020061 TaxID=3317345 RepID=UPI00362D5F59
MILFDTNIFIDMLGGCHQAAVELNSYDEPAVSVITLMELRAGQALRPDDKSRLDPFLETFVVLPIDERITEVAIEIRGRSLLHPPKVKLPDAIIGATAEVWGIAIITRNARDFKDLTVHIHQPYHLDSQSGRVSQIRPPYNGPARRAITRVK